MQKDVTYEQRVTSPKCLCCKSEKSDVVNAMLGRLGQKDALVGGSVITIAKIAAWLGRVEGITVHPSALLRHRKNHLVEVEPESPEAGKKASVSGLSEEDIADLEAELTRLCEMPAIDSASIHLLHLKIHALTMRSGLRQNGKLPPISPAMATTSAQALSRQEFDLQSGLMLNALAGGISQVFQKALGPDSDNPPPPQLPEAIDGEVVDEDDSDE